jgi:TRAP-type C4-dicarboxylate transport system permease small subunit
VKFSIFEGDVSARVSWLTDRVETLLGAMLVLCVVLNFSNVVARYLFNTALFGIEEVQVYLVVAIAFVGAVVVSWKRQHLRMDALVDRFGPRTRRHLGGVEAVLVLALAGFACVQSGRYTWQMVQIGRKSDLMEIPMWLPHGSVTLGMFLITAIAAWRLFVPASRSDAAPVAERDEPGVAAEVRP